MVALPSFAQENATIHGVDKLWTAQSSTKKTFWAVVLLICVCLMCFEAQKTVREYLQTPVAVTIRAIAVSGLPPVLICPSVWADRAKLAKLGNATELYRFWLSHYFDMEPEEMQLIHPKLHHLEYFISKDDDLNRTLKNDDLRRPSAIKRIVSRYGTIKEFLLDIMKDPMTVFQPAMYIPIPDKKMPTNHGGCYLLNESHLQLPTLIAPYIYRDILVRNVKAPFFDAKRSTERLYFGDTVFSTQPDGRVDIASGTDAIIYLTAKEESKVNTAAKPCKPGKDMSNQMGCILSCVNQHICSICKFIDVLDTTASLANVCTVQHAFRHKAHCAFELYLNGTKMRMSRCEKECPMSCKQTIYYYTVVQVKGISPVGSHTTGIRYKFHRALETQYLEESYVYSWHTLVCNIGGVFSLLLGVSVITVVQLIVYFASLITIYG